MAVFNLAGGATGNSGVLSADTLFAVESGTIDLSTDAGTTYITFFGPKDKVIFSNGLTVHYRNPRPDAAIMKTMVA